MTRLALLVAATLLTMSATLLTMSAASAAPVDPPPEPSVEPATPDGYRPLPAPQRLVDTRTGARTADGEFAGIGERRADSTLAIDVAGRVGLDDEPGAVILNVTVTSPGDLGFLTVWPCDEQRPTASNLNYISDQTVAVAALSRGRAGRHRVRVHAGGDAPDRRRRRRVPDRHVRTAHEPGTPRRHPRGRAHDRRCIRR